MHYFLRHCGGYEARRCEVGVEGGRERARPGRKKKNARDGGGSVPRWTGLHGHDRPTRLCWGGVGAFRAPPIGLSKNCVWAPVRAVSTSHKAFRSCGIFAQTSHEVAGLWDRLWDPAHIRRRIRPLTATISGQGSHKHPTIVPQTACYNSLIGGRSTSLDRPVQALDGG